MRDIVHFLMENNCSREKIDIMFFRKSSEMHFIIVQIYVDDPCTKNKIK